MFYFELNVILAEKSMKSLKIYILVVKSSRNKHFHDFVQRWDLKKNYVSI